MQSLGLCELSTQGSEAQVLTEAKRIRGVAWTERSHSLHLAAARHAAAGVRTPGGHICQFLNEARQRNLYEMPQHQNIGNSTITQKTKHQVR